MILNYYKSYDEKIYNIYIYGKVSKKTTITS